MTCSPTKGIDPTLALSAELNGAGHHAVPHIAARLVTGREHVEKIAYYHGLGFYHLVFHAPGPDQPRFLKLYGEQVLPRLRKRFG